MSFLGWIGRALGPIVLEHSLPLLRDWWKGRANQSRTDQLQQLAGDVEQLRDHAEQVDANLITLNSNVEALNNGLTAREEKLRKWMLMLLIWNVAISLGLVMIAVLVFRRN